MKYFLYMYCHMLILFVCHYYVRVSNTIYYSSVCDRVVQGVKKRTASGLIPGHNLYAMEAYFHFELFSCFLFSKFGEAKNKSGMTYIKSKR